MKQHRRVVAQCSQSCTGDVAALSLSSLRLMQCPDYDPNMYPERVEECDAAALARSMSEYDSVDVKTCDS
jgi:hypothetical protein